jgi:hypothetical protein
MKKNKIIAYLLFFCALAMLTGMFLNIDIYWFIVDIIVILICSITGYLILKNKNF